MSKKCPNESSYLYYNTFKKYNYAVGVGKFSEQSADLYKKVSLNVYTDI